MSENFNGCCFEFRGRHSSELGLSICHDNGLFERSFGINRDIQTETTRGNPSSLLFGFEDKPLEGSMTIMSKIPWTLEHQRAVADWLYTTEFCEFISEDCPDIVYKLVFTGDMTLATGFRDEGFVEVEFVCDAPWGWSKPLIQTYDLTPKILENGFRFDTINISNVSGYNAIELEITLPPSDKAVNFGSFEYSFRNARK